MINCKVCNKEYDNDFGHQTLCPICLKYNNKSCSFSNEIESESLIEKNYYLIFFPSYKEANVVETIEGNKPRIIKTFPLEELNHELAIQWIKKLETYALFQ